jgi:hypothetical protein
MSEKPPLWVVCDASGSMSEGAKHLIARGVARVTEQYFRLGYGSADLKLVAWNKEARVVDWIPDQEFPPEMVVCESAAHAKALISLLGEQPDGKVLLITDGFWSQDDSKVLKRWKESLQQDTLRVIKIGADANPQLKWADVFAAEDLFAALDGWMEGGAA